jgi:hypothetical protein
VDATLQLEDAKPAVARDELAQGQVEEILSGPAA